MRRNTQSFSGLKIRNASSASILKTNFKLALYFRGFLIQIGKNSNMSIFRNDLINWRIQRLNWPKNGGIFALKIFLMFISIQLSKLGNVCETSLFPLSSYKLFLPSLFAQASWPVVCASTKAQRSSPCQATPIFCIIPFLETFRVLEALKKKSSSKEDTRFQK